MHLLYNLLTAQGEGLSSKYKGGLFMEGEECGRNVVSQCPLYALNDPRRVDARENA